MSSRFNDHFSSSSPDYAQYRPHYPDELYFHLSHITAQHRYAWDCATGTGQSALQLTKYFQRVFATDASESQIKHAIQNKKICYSVAPAESSGLEDHSIDLITVAQALHWFDLDAFSLEVNRVLADHGVLAAWTYNLLHINEDIDYVVNHLYTDLLAPYWPAERKLVENNYQDIHFPFTELASPYFEMSAHWNLQKLVGYLNTWSALQRYQTEKKTNPIELIYSELAAAWGDPQQELLMSWPLTLRLWHKT